jgi:hypothetical protein
MTKQNLTSPQCSSHVSNGRRQCRSKSSFLFIWNVRNQPVEQPRCSRHANVYLSAPALPESLTIATWEPTKAAAGWLF